MITNFITVTEFKNLYLCTVSHRAWVFQSIVSVALFVLSLMAGPAVDDYLKVILKVHSDAEESRFGSIYSSHFIPQTPDLEKLVLRQVVPNCEKIPPIVHVVNVLN